MSAKKVVAQSTLTTEGKAFWKTVEEQHTKGRFIQFVDKVPQVVELSNWNPIEVDSMFGKKPVLVCDGGAYLKIESQRLKKELAEFVNQTVKLEIIRYDSTPDSRKTWYQVTKI